eukprot:366082-Chlamydomonas_euryale.AAC.39
MCVRAGQARAVTAVVLSRQARENVVGSGCRPGGARRFRRVAQGGARRFRRVAQGGARRFRRGAQGGARRFRRVAQGGWRKVGRGGSGGFGARWGAAVRAVKAARTYGVEAAQMIQMRII